MPAIKYACEVCESIFEDKDTAKQCEDAHYKLEDLCVIEVGWRDKHRIGFPHKVTVKNSRTGDTYSYTR